MKAKDLQDKEKSYLIIMYNRALSQYMHDAVKELELKEDNITTYGKCFSWKRMKMENGNLVHGNVDIMITFLLMRHRISREQH